MKKFFALATLLFLATVNQCLTAQTNAAPRNHPVPPRFFQMEAHDFNLWPAIPMDGIRLWGTGTTWADLNPADGVYNWRRLDGWLKAAEKHHVNHILYTMAFTPQWASSNPNDQTCKIGPGQCDPPNDLNPDGSGTDKHWKDFVAAIATHSAGRIRDWEVWNEPVNGFYWTGTFPQMVRMAKDARTVILSIDPKAKMLTPPNGVGSTWVDKWWIGYAAAGGLQYADIAAIHGGVKSDCSNPPNASDFLTHVEDLRSILSSFHQSKPVWDTESNWGKVSKDCFTDQDLQAAFLAQFYFFHRSKEVSRFYWYSYDDPDTGQLFDLHTGKLTKGGVAYQQVYNWMLGKTLSTCSAEGTIWTCGFADPQGYQGEAIWDTAETCSNGTCQTVEYRVDKTYTQYRTLSGETISITGGRVPIGAKPILVEN